MKYGRSVLFHAFELCNVIYTTNYTEKEALLIGYIFDVTTEDDLNLLGGKKPKIIKITDKKLANLLQENSNNLNSIIEEITRGLLSKTITIKYKNSNNFEVLPSFSRIAFIKNELIIECPYKYIPLLLDIKQKYPNGGWKYAIRFTSNTALKLYQLLHQSNQSEVILHLSQLKQKFASLPYTQYQNLKQHIIDTSLGEINSKTNLYVTYEEIKKNQEVKQLRFLITAKNKLTSPSTNTLM